MQSKVLSMHATTMNWIVMFFKQHTKNITSNNQLGSNDNLCGELRLFFRLYMADLSEVHVYTEFQKFFSISKSKTKYSPCTQPPWTGLCC